MIHPWSILQVNVYLDLFSMEATNRERHQRLTNACLNLRLQRRGFGVMAKSVVEYCDQAGHQVEEGEFTGHGIILIIIQYCFSF